MNQSPISTIEKQIKSLPVLPAIVARVMEVTEDPECSASDLVKVILPDQAMCSTILKVANSAFFGIPKGVSTIERAIVVLGYEEIKNIVIGKAIFSSFTKLNKQKHHTLSLFWEHAFTCGLAAKAIGNDLHFSPSECFIAGLIHDIGKLAMLMAFPNDYPIMWELSNPCNSDVLSEEQANFGISHDRVGLQLAERWLLPEQLVVAIGYHHQPQKAACCTEYPLVVQAADTLSLLYCHSNSMERYDVERIFMDFLPETSALWRQHDLDWKTENFGLWFDLLREQRENNQEVLSAFSRS